MKIINLEQRSLEWLEWRKKKITATDASVLSGCNYKKPAQLWAEKLGLVESEQPNQHMLRGELLEPVAREIFNKSYHIQVVPAVVEHDTYCWAGASLDGISGDGKTLLEIKCPSERNHWFSLEFGIMDYWYAQIQHQLFITDADICWFMSYNPDFEAGMQWILRPIVPDKEYIASLVARERYFYDINLGMEVEPDYLEPMFVDREVCAC